MTHIPRIFATKFMFVYLRHGVMLLESNKQIRVDKIRKTPPEPTGPAGFFAPFYFSTQLLGGACRTRKGPTTHSTWRGLWILLRRLTQARVFLLPFIPRSRIEEHRPGWDAVAHAVQPGCTQRNRLAALAHREVMRLLTGRPRTCRQHSEPSSVHLTRLNILSARRAAGSSQKTNRRNLQCL